MEFSDEERILFHAGAQRELMRNAASEAGLSMTGLGKRFEAGASAAKKWCREEVLLPGKVANVLQRLCPKSWKHAESLIVQIKPGDWGQTAGGRKTYNSILRRYGEEEMQRRRSHGGKASAIQRRKPLNIPTDAKLLEFYGVMLGDGCLSYFKIKDGRMRRFVRIDGSSENDLVYFQSHLHPLLESLFGKRARIKFRKDCRGIVIMFHSYSIATLLENRFSFPVGKKPQNVSIPASIFNEPLDRLLHILRGFADTDGSLFFHYGRYPRITLTNKSAVLLRQFDSVLRKYGFTTKLYKNKTTGVTQLRIIGRDQLERWMKLIGFNNPNHLTKYLHWKRFGHCPSAKMLPFKERLKRLGFTADFRTKYLGPYAVGFGQQRHSPGMLSPV